MLETEAEKNKTEIERLEKENKRILDELEMIKRKKGMLNSKLPFPEACAHPIEYL